MPANVSPQVGIGGFPAHVRLPPYAETGEPPPPPEHPDVKDGETLDRMRGACQLAKRILAGAGELCTPGVTTELIGQFVHDMCVAASAYPSPLNYRGFPHSVCTSVNNVAAHGIPDDRPLVCGDIINVDVTVFLDGVHGDCSKTFLVGDVVDEAARRLVREAEACLSVGVSACGPGRPFSGVGGAIEAYARRKGFRVVPAFTGHGIGQYFHGPPDIYHCRNRYPGTMRPGMTFTVEPIISEGAEQIELLDDGWTAVSADDSRSAQFEHTCLITQHGVEILTA